MPSSLPWNTLFGFTEALYLAGAREEAGAFLPLFHEALGIGIEWITFDCRLVHSRAAIAAAGAREWDEAEEHLRSALSRAEEIDHGREQADLRYLRARILLDRGRLEDVAEVKSSIEEAVDSYQAMGLPGRVDLASPLNGQSVPVQ